MILIDDADDARLALFRRNERGLANRPQRRTGDGLFMAEGDLVVERALDAGCVPVAALVDASRPPAVAIRLAAQIEVFAGGDQVRAMVTQLGVPLAVVAVFHRPPRATVEALAHAATRLVVIEAVDNPANVGSIARNAAALGWHGLVVDRTSADPLTRRSLRVSMGQALVLPHARVEDLSAALRSLREHGFVVCALTPAVDAMPLHEVRPAPRIAIVIGSERAGLSADTLAAANLCTRIPMASGVDSLNAAAASAIACYALRPPT